MASTALAALPAMLTVKDIAAYFSISEKTARAKMHRIGCARDGKYLYVMQPDLLAYLSELDRRPQTGNKPDPAPAPRKRKRRWQYNPSAEHEIPRRKPNGA